MKNRIMRIIAMLVLCAGTVQMAGGLSMMSGAASLTGAHVVSAEGAEDASAEEAAEAEEAAAEAASGASGTSGAEGTESAADPQEVRGASLATLIKHTSADRPAGRNKHVPVLSPLALQAKDRVLRFAEEQALAAAEAEAPLTPEAEAQAEAEALAAAQAEAQAQAQAQAAAQAQAEAQAQAPPAPAPAPVQGNGRMLFIGDSRTIDMFVDSDEPIYGRVEGNIVVYAMHARGYAYMADTVNQYGHENYDTLITWMGANDAGYFAPYEAYYNQLLAAGKKIIVCTVGPTNDANYTTEQELRYTNDKMVAFNAQLVAWAAAHGVQVIDLYSYIVGNVAIDPDGVHYLPRPTTQIWQVIVGSL